MTVFYKLQKTTGGLPINSKMKVMPVRQIAVDFESLAQKISVGTTFSSADLIGALDALKEAMIVGSTSPTSKPLSEMEIDNALRLLFAQQQVLTVGQLQDYLHLRHTFAYRLVKNLEMKGKIRNIGSAHRKVFVPGEVLNVPSEQ